MKPLAHKVNDGPGVDVRSTAASAESGLRRSASRFPLGRLVAVRADDSAFPKIVACVRGAFDYFRRTSRERSAQRLAADRLAEALADTTRRLFVLEDAAGVPAGLLELALGTPHPSDVTVALLLIDQKLRGQGLGREVAEALYATLARAGFCRMRLGVARGEDEAAHFWASVGMWECGNDDGVRLFERPLR